MDNIDRNFRERRKTEYELHLENQEKIAAALLETAKKFNLTIDEQVTSGNIDLHSISDGRLQDIDNIGYYSDRESYTELLESEEIANDDRILGERKKAKLRGESLDGEQFLESFGALLLDDSREQALKSLENMLQKTPEMFDGPTCPLCKYQTTNEEIKTFGKCALCRRRELISKSPPINSYEDNNYFYSNKNAYSDSSQSRQSSRNSKNSLQVQGSSKPAGTNTDLVQVQVPMIPGKGENIPNIPLGRKQAPKNTLIPNSNTISPATPPSPSPVSLEDLIDPFESEVEDVDIESDQDYVIRSIQKLKLEVRELQIENDRIFRYEDMLKQILKVKITLFFSMYILFLI